MSDARRRATMLDLGAFVTRTLPIEWFGEAVELVQDVRDRAWTQAEKREFACGMLMRHLDIGETEARALVHLALLWLQRGS